MHLSLGNTQDIINTQIHYLLPLVTREKKKIETAGRHVFLAKKLCALCTQDT